MHIHKPSCMHLLEKIGEEINEKRLTRNEMLQRSIIRQDNLSPHSQSTRQRAICAEQLALALQTYCTMLSYFGWDQPRQFVDSARKELLSMTCAK